MKCPYCQTEVTLVTGQRIYPRSRKFWNLAFHLCERCGAYAPPGRTLANEELRRLRGTAHFFFDRIWKEGLKKRGACYAELRERFGLSAEEGHIGSAREDMCRKIIVFAQEWYKELTSEQTTRS